MGAALLLSLVWMGGCGFAGSAGTPKPPKPQRPFRVLAFWATGSNVTLSPLNVHKQAISAVVPLFYAIAGTGAIKDKVVPSVLRQVRSDGIPVVPSFTAPMGQAFLGSIPSRLLVARHIASIVRTQHYQGVNIDFEPARPRYRAGLAAFIVDLRDLLPPRSQLYLDTIPGDSAAYNYRAMTPEVTGYDFMTYDEHDDGSVAGPVAATSWVLAKVNRLKTLVPANKILMGIAFYGYDWLNGTTHAVTISLNHIPAEALKVARYDPSTEEMHARYTLGGVSHDLWWETPQGINAKVRAAETMGLQGVAVWRLGYQTTGLTTILGAIQTQRAHSLKVPHARTVPSNSHPARKTGARLRPHPSRSRRSHPYP